MTDLPPGAEALMGAAAGELLDSVLAADGSQLLDWAVRSVHQRGSSSVAVVYEVELTDGAGDHLDRLYVGHVSTRQVPPGAVVVDVDGAPVHVWRFPHDPYLPGLPDAVDRRAAARLLARLGLADEAAVPAIRTRSYRPTRRAVVELRSGRGEPPLAYCKLLGGRDAAAIRRRSDRLVVVHERLGGHLPVARVLEHDAAAGQVVLSALPGRSLREVLRSDGRLPDAGALRDLVAGLQASPPLPGGADPDAYADVTRHVARLRRRMPARGVDLDRVAAVAARVGGPRGTVHGDLHDGQLLVQDGTVTGVLDIDGAADGLVAHDLGRLLAHLDASTLALPDDAHRVEAYVAELESALLTLAPAADVRAAAAGAWLGLATGPLRVASPHWREEVAARIDRAVAWARRAA